MMSGNDVRRNDLLRQLQRRGCIYAFTAHMRKRLRVIADEPGVEVVEFSPPLQLPQFAAPVVAVARMVAGG